jgi:hypothetical protein
MGGMKGRAREGQADDRLVRRFFLECARKDQQALSGYLDQGRKVRAREGHADDRLVRRFFLELATMSSSARGRAGPRMGEKEARKLWDSLGPEQREYWRGQFLMRIEQERDLGRVLITKFLSIWARVEFSEISDQHLEQVAKWAGCATVDDLCLALGQGRVKIKGNTRLAPPHGSPVIEHNPSEVFLAAFPESSANIALLARHRRRLDETKKPRYTRKAPSSSSADTRQKGMRDDFNSSVKAANAPLNAAVKAARTETLARLVDLDNPALSSKERLRRARRVKASFERRRVEDPEYPASPEVRKAISIVNNHNYETAKARKAGAKLAM